MSLSKFNAVLLDGEPSNLPLQSQVTGDFESRERSIGELLEQRLLTAASTGDLTISSTDNRPVVIIDAYVWNLWQIKSVPVAEDAEVIYSSQSEQVKESVIELDLSDDAILSLVSFMYTGKFFQDYKAVLEISEKSTELGLHPFIIKAAAAIITKEMTIDNVMNAWINPSDAISDMSKSFKDLSISFVLSCPDIIFTPTEPGQPMIPRKLLECLLPANLKLNIDDYRDTAAGRWDLKVRERDSGKMFLEMKHSQLAHFLCRWALNQFRSQEPSFPYPSLLQMEQILGDLVLMLDPMSFDATNPENMDLNRFPPNEQSTGVFYYLMLVTSRSMSLDFKSRNLASECSFVCSPAVPEDGMNARKKRGLHYAIAGPSQSQSVSSVKMEPVPGSSKKSKIDPAANNPVLQLLIEEFEKMRLTDVSFVFGPDNECVKAHSFVLSLQSTRLANYFRHNSNTSWEFQLGNEVDEKMVKAFVKLFYADKLPQGKLLEDCLRLASHMKISNIMKRSFIDVQRMAISKCNATLKYHFEELLGEESRLAQIFGFIKQNLFDIINEGSVGMFETMDFMKRVLGLKREPTSEYAMIMSIIRWGKYNDYSEEDMRTLVTKTFKDLINLKFLHTSHINSLVETHKILTYMEGLKSAKEDNDINDKAGSSQEATGEIDTFGDSYYSQHTSSQEAPPHENVESAEKENRVGRPRIYKKDFLYKCYLENCSYESRNPYLFFEHESRHKNEKTFSCTFPNCPWSFTRSSHLKRHVNTCHKKSERFKCTFQGCNKSYSRQDALKRHQTDRKHLG